MRARRQRMSWIVLFRTWPRVSTPVMFCGGMSDARPIGVFDSGIGGLTVVKALRDLLPNESICYLGDTARVPYGGKNPETVQRYAVELAGIFTQKKAKELVVA